MVFVGLLNGGEKDVNKSVISDDDFLARSLSPRYGPVAETALVSSFFCVVEIHILHVSLEHSLLPQAPSSR